MEEKDFLLSAFFGLFSDIIRLYPKTGKAVFLKSSDERFPCGSSADFGEYFAAFFSECSRRETAGLIGINRRCDNRESGELFSCAYPKDGRIIRSTLWLSVPEGYPAECGSVVICRAEQCEEQKPLKVKTFGSFEVYDASGAPLKFTRKKARQLFAYIIDKHGYPVSISDIAADVLEKPENDLNAKKYVSALIRSAADDLRKAGFADVILKEWNSVRVNVDMIDCDYYHLLDGDSSYRALYHNEYMQEYSWAEETNAELMQGSL